MSAYGTEKGRRYLHRRQAGKQAGSRITKHTTKELRRCMIRGERWEEDRRRWRGRIQRQPTFCEGAGGTAGKVLRRSEGRKEGRKVVYRGAARGAREAIRDRERWRFPFKRHQRACRKFSPVPAPPAPLVVPGIIRDRVQSTRIHAFQAGVPEFRAVV